MLLVHRVSRREIGLLSSMVAVTTAGDVQHSNAVARHAREILDALHHHHIGEDEILWPRLRERAADHQPLIETMERQHGRIGATVDRVEKLLPRWQIHPTSTHAAALSAALSEAHAAVVEPLDDEEVHLLPLVERTITEPEWNELRVRGIAGISKRRLPVFLAYMLEEATPPKQRHCLLMCRCLAEFFTASSE